LTPDLKFASSVAVFFCRHTFHEDCLPAHAAASTKFAFNKLHRKIGYFTLNYVHHTLSLSLYIMSLTDVTSC